MTQFDMWQVGQWGVSGLGVGVIYAIASVWFKQKSNADALSPRTEELASDKELFALFCQLQQYRKLNEKSFSRAVDYADALVFRHQQLTNKKIDPTLHDRPECFAALQTCTKNLRVLLAAAKDHPEPRVPAHVFRLCSRIEELVKLHWTAVMRLTRDIKVGV